MRQESGGGGGGGRTGGGDAPAAAPGGGAEPDVISRCIGEFGRWQLLITFLLSLFNIPCTFHIFAPTFEAGLGDFWCARPPQFRHIPHQQWINITGTTKLSPSGKQVYDPCVVKNVLGASSYEELLELANTTESIACPGWEYDKAHFGETIISEWDLVCERGQLSNLAEMMFLLGVALGGLASGVLSDRFGRKRTLMTSLVAQVVLGTMVAMTPWYSLYVVFRGILGFFCVSIVFSGFVLCMEVVGGKWLTISGCSYLFPLPLSYITVSGIAYYIRDWRELQLAITLPAIVFLCLWWVFPESPRWLLTMGKVDKAMVVLEEAARFNKKQLPPNADKLLKQSVSKVDSEDPPKASIFDLFRTPTIRKISLILYLIWFSVYIIYYGLVLNLSNLGGNVYLNAVISGAVELPSIAVSILFLLKMGRRWPLCLTIMGAGIACLLTITIPKGEEYSWVTIALAMVGKFSISSSNVVMPIFTAELFPTTMRNMGMGASNVPAGIALMIVPYLWNMAGMNMNLPMGVLGVCGVCGGASVLLLPETGDGAGLADTIQDIEKPESS